MGYSAKHVANYFLSNHRDTGITPLKLQKIVYIAHGWYMANYEDPLVDDEFAEAWPYGPVFPSLYHEFKHVNRRPITAMATEFSGENYDVELQTPQIPEDDVRTRTLLDKVWENLWRRQW